MLCCLISSGRYGYRPAKPLPSGVRQCRALSDQVDWRFLAVFPAPGAVRGACLTYFVLEPPQVTVPRYQFHCLSELPPAEGEQFPALSFTCFSPQGLGFAATLSRKPLRLAQAPDVNSYPVSAFLCWHASLLFNVAVSAAPLFSKSICPLITFPAGVIRDPGQVEKVDHTQYIQRGLRFHYQLRASNGLLVCFQCRLAARADPDILARLANPCQFLRAWKTVLQFAILK